MSDVPIKEGIDRLHFSKVGDSLHRLDYAMA